jgi:hypothetical protein
MKLWFITGSVWGDKRNGCNEYKTTKAAAG